MRAIGGIPVDRAKLRATLAYRVADDLQVGIEANPLAPDVGPIANWRAVDETESRPAIVLGTSSDRIGTPHGRAIYATASKDLEAWTGWPVAPYVGASFGTYDDELVAIGGLLVRWTDRFSSTHLWDGHELHHLGTWGLEGGASLGFLLVTLEEEHYVGLTFATRLGG